MKKTRFLGLIATGLAIAVFAASCGKKKEETASAPVPKPAPAVQEAKQVFSIGYAIPLTGPAVSYSEIQKKAVEIALTEVNEARAPQAAKMKVLWEDSKLDPSVAVTAMKKLIDVDKVPVVLGFSSGEILSMAATANRTQTVLVAPMASAAAISEAGQFVFRLSPSDTFQGKVIADVICGDGKKKVAVLYVNNDWGAGLKGSFTTQLKKLGAVVAIEEPSNPEDKDFRTQLAKIKGASPEALVLFLHPQEAIHAIRQIREMKLEVALYGGDTFSDASICEKIPSLAEGIVFALPAKPSSPEFQAFAKKYEAKFGEKPDINAAVGYDSVKLVAAVMDKVGTTGEAIRQELAATKGYRGASGEVSFDANGDVVSKQFDVLVIRGGKPVAR